MKWWDFKMNMPNLLLSTDFFLYLLNKIDKKCYYLLQVYTYLVLKWSTVGIWSILIKSFDIYSNLFSRTSQFEGCSQREFNTYIYLDPECLSTDDKSIFSMAIFMLMHVQEKRKNISLSSFETPPLFSWWFTQEI